MMTRRPGLCAAVLSMMAVSGVVAQPPREEGAVVRELVVRPVSEAPIPRVGAGAPQYTAAEIQVIQEEARRTVSEAQTAVRLCLRQNAGFINPPSIRAMLGQAYQIERDAALKVQSLSAEAAKATEDARQIRLEAAQGKRTEDELAASELARQKAVNALVSARNDLSDASAAIPVMQRSVRQLDPLPVGGDPSALEGAAVSRVLHEVDMFKAGRARDRLRRTRPPFADLAIENVAVREGEDRRGAFLSVSGAIRNPREHPVLIPSLEITQFDGYGFILDQVIVDAGRGQIAPGASRPFAYQYRPKAQRARTVRVTFDSAEPLPLRLPPGAPIARTLAPRGPPTQSSRGGLAGEHGRRPGVFADSTAPDCSG
jgi:hypothetical protein